MEKRLVLTALNNLVDTIEARHPFLDALLFSDQGIGLMNTDAQITDLVHRHFTAQAVPVLSIHDSFIVDCCRVGELKRRTARLNGQQPWACGLAFSTC